MVALKRLNISTDEAVQFDSFKEDQSCRAWVVPLVVLAFVSLASLTGLFLLSCRWKAQRKELAALTPINSNAIHLQSSSGK